jgi:GH25 family lysozyme M1 (1,4-beta-N-acetylmuramidase)
MGKPLNVVIDISHHQEEVDFRKVRAAGIVGVIHKATEGFRFVDRLYHARRKEAFGAGLLWGAYHFGVGGDGSDQADHFLETVEPSPETLLVLDYEPNLTGPTMTLDQAREFVSRLNDAAGRFPGLYSGHLIKEQLGDVTTPDPILSRCFLWIAQYQGARPVNIPGTFPTWTLWQYTDGVHWEEPHRVDGVGLCDRDMFNGGMEQLRRLWGVPPESLPARERSSSRRKGARRRRTRPAR